MLHRACCECCAWPLSGLGTAQGRCHRGCHYLCVSQRPQLLQRGLGTCREAGFGPHRKSASCGRRCRRARKGPPRRIAPLMHRQNLKPVCSGATIASKVFDSRLSLLLCLHSRRRVRCSFAASPHRGVAVGTTWPPTGCTSTPSDSWAEWCCADGSLSKQHYANCYIIMVCWLHHFAHRSPALLGGVYLHTITVTSIKPSNMLPICALSNRQPGTFGSAATRGSQPSTLYSAMVQGRTAGRALYSNGTGAVHLAAAGGAPCSTTHAQGGLVHGRELGCAPCSSKHLVKVRATPRPRLRHIWVHAPRLLLVIVCKVP